jgi:hypothetical protein
MIAANNGWLIVLDNLSWITTHLSDCLCRLSTGAAFATRTLYENDDETIFVAQRPAIINGIEVSGFRSDLLDRSLIVELPQLAPGKRRTKAAFWRDFEQARPRILGALLDAVAAALKNLPAVEQSKVEWPRMADFAQWVVAGEKAMGLPSGSFLKAYEQNRADASRAALESSVVVTALLALLKRKGGSFMGTATELLDALATGQDTRSRNWPKNARALSGQLQRLATNLRAAGVSVEQDRADNRKLWRIKMEMKPATSAARPSASSQNSQKPAGKATRSTSGLAEQLAMHRK